MDNAEETSGEYFQLSCDIRISGFQRCGIHTVTVSVFRVRFYGFVGGEIVESLPLYSSHATVPLSPNEFSFLNIFYFKR